MEDQAPDVFFIPDFSANLGLWKDQSCVFMAHISKFSRDLDEN